MSDAPTVLVTGATGFIGRRLVPALVERGLDVRAMTRSPEKYDGRGARRLPATCTTAHRWTSRWTVWMSRSTWSTPSTTPTSSARTPRRARTFGRAAAAAGVRQIVYLGGLGADGADLSPHLRSRREVEGLLGEAGVPVTVLRAAIVVGAGGISWELTRQLVKNLPAMVVPRWVSTRTQPIAVDDVIRYLAGVVAEPRRPSAGSSRSAAPTG